VSEREELDRGSLGRPERILAVIPCLNEAIHLEKVVDGLLQESETLDLLIVIADGGSTDGTIEISKRLAVAYPNVRYIHNAKRIQSAAVNSAAVQFGEGRNFLVRVDAHCDYPASYCQRLLEAQQSSAAASVTVSMVAQGRTCFQRAAAAAQNSPLGNGGSAHRMTGTGRFTDHGHHALMSIPAFLSVDGYDEGFTHNEDAELDMRLTRAGYKIWLMASNPIIYYPRQKARRLLSQYLSYGKGRARTALKHKQRLKPRQALPLMVAPAVLLAPIGAVYPLAVLPAALWTALCLTYGFVLGARSGSFCAALSGVAAMIMHFGWSAGFLSEILGHTFKSRKGKSNGGMQLSARGG
jgi:succinoglycan biosynthesis protein ExoA